MSVKLSAFSQYLAASKCQVFMFISFGSAIASLADLQIARTETPARPANVNRDRPLVDQPRMTLAFSENPTADEFFRARAFEEPLVPIGDVPSAAENAALAIALRGYANRRGPDDFASLTDFLERFPKSPWQAALLTDVGLEYYNTAHYSLAIEAWRKAWSLAKEAADEKGTAIADRAAGELAYMYARLGRMTELDALLKSVEGRVFLGQATEKITGAREALWNMQNRPEISFRCGPLALQQIRRAENLSGPEDAEIFNSASTQDGICLPSVAELSRRVGLNYQMAFREKGGDFIIPSVVHWKVGHYAALVRQEGDRYLLQDPTFGTDVWATQQALEAETSGYFLIPPGPLPLGWRGVPVDEGARIRGKGVGSGSGDPGCTGTGDGKTGGSCKESRMAVSSVHLMLVNLNISDAPVGYSPPVGPPVEFTVRYNHRDAFQPANFTYSNFGAKWTCDWISYITDNPQSPSANVNYYIMGGGSRTFTSFDTNTQSFAYQLYDQTLLTRTGPASYQMLSRDGSKLVFSQSDGSIGTARKIFLTQILDPFGNAVSLSYDGNLRLTTITDAIGQVTTLTYGQTNDIYKITKVADPFGRFALFDYDSTNRLAKITDVIGITSQFTYEGSGDFINSLITPYGTTIFTRGQMTNITIGVTNVQRWLETHYPDGSRDRVEFMQSTNIGLPFSVPAAELPQGVTTFNQYLYGRNTFYWSRNACATGYGDYSKARIYHWLHMPDNAVASGVLESTKEPLENRVWYSYAGQSFPYHIIGSSDRPTRVGRVLDDGSTQLYISDYDGFGHVTNSVDPVGRTMTYIYSTNGIDLLEVRMTRAGKNELLAKTTYNAQHQPLTITDAAGQTTTNTYNARGQVLTTSNPKGETTTYTYDANGYLVKVDGALPGTNDTLTATYDAFGRIRTKTDESGHTLTFDHDAMDRLTRATFPDGTFDQYTFNRLDPATITDRAGRQTVLEHDSMRQMIKRTDPLNRVTLFQWCSCGELSSLTDPMGRTTTWNKDVQGRLTSKQYGDGSQVRYFYENATSRVRQVIDEKQQMTQYTFNRDDTLVAVAYANTAVPTPSVSYTYDANYDRVTSMTDGTGKTLYSFNPITASPALGAGQLASVDGPMPNDTITYGYDELSRRVSTTINGAVSVKTHDAAGRVVGEANALGTFSRAYDGVSYRLVAQTFPNGQIEERSYAGNLLDRMLQRITHKLGTTPISEFTYGRDLAANRITTWSQQAGAQSPLLHTYGYDTANQLLSATVTNAGTLVTTFGYTYDPSGNRLTERVSAATNVASYNALNQLSTTMGPGATHTNEWDAEDRLVTAIAGNLRTEFTYDGLGRLASLRLLLTNGFQVSLRRFLWCDNELCEERDASGTVVAKRYFDQGVKIETGPMSGAYYYTRDHLDSIRELTDSSGNVRARYSYDPYGRRTRLAGDVEADFGFAGMFWAAEAGLAITRFRAYDPALGRWLSRDPLRDAEEKEGPNLYAYAANNPVNVVDPLGLCCDDKKAKYEQTSAIGDALCQAARDRAKEGCAKLRKEGPKQGFDKKYIEETCAIAYQLVADTCRGLEDKTKKAKDDYEACLGKPCVTKCKPKPKIPDDFFDSRH